MAVRPLFFYPFVKIGREFTGGDSRSLIRLPEALSSHGIKSVVVSKAVKGLPNKEKYSDDITVCRIGTSRKTILCIPTVLRLAAENHSNVIHFWLTADPLSLVLGYCLFTIPIGKKSVCLFDHVFELSSFRERLLAYVGLSVFRRADAILTLSYYQRRKLIELGVDPSKIFTLHTCVDENVFTPGQKDCVSLKNLNVRSSELIVSYVKGSDFEAENIISQVIPPVIMKHPNVKFLFIGDFSVGKLRRFAEEKGVLGSVCFTGVIPSSEVPRFISISDVCLFLFDPRKGHQPYPSFTKIAEYMASGKCIVSANIVGVSEVLEDGKEGILVDSGKEMVQAILFLIRHPERVRKYGENARRKVAQNFSYERTAEKMLKIYEEILERKFSKTSRSE